MASWHEVEAEAPALAEAVRARFDAHRHMTLATLRQAGTLWVSPRISGIEVAFVDGELWFGGWADSRKVIDLRRDARFALHSGTADAEFWPGDANVAGRAVAISDPATIAAVVGASGGEPSTNSSLFREDLSEVALTRLAEPPDHLVVKFWRMGQGGTAVRAAVGTVSQPAAWQSVAGRLTSCRRAVRPAGAGGTSWSRSSMVSPPDSNPSCMSSCCQKPVKALPPDCPRS